MKPEIVSYYDKLDKECLLALIFRRNNSDPAQDGVKFLTDPQESLQVATLSHPVGKRVDPHFHPPITWKQRQDTPKEVLLIRYGSVQIDFYDYERQLVTSKVLWSGDIAILIAGGHGLTMLSDCEIFEVREGPYRGLEDKIRF